MKTRRFLIESLCSHLKAQQITYKDIAQSLSYWPPAAAAAPAG